MKGTAFMKRTFFIVIIQIAINTAFITLAYKLGDDDWSDG